MDTSKQKTSKKPPTREELQSWLIAKVAAALEVDPAEIDPNEPFTRYGLDSVNTVAVAMDIEEWLGRRLPDTMLWDYPSIADLADYLANEASKAR